jgi:hypothetical protein
MKQLTGLIIIMLLGGLQAFAQNDAMLVDHCVSLAGDDATYLKDFVVKLPAANNNAKPPAAKNSIMLRKNTVYRFTVCNHEESDGEAVITLYDANQMLASNYNPSSGKMYPSFNFSCSKTGPYTLMISFKDGKKGSAVGVMSYVRRQ